MITSNGDEPESDPAGTLPDEAIVVRGGIIASTEALIEQAETAAADGEGYVLSTFAAVANEGESEEELLSRIVTDGRIPNGRVRTTTAARLRAAGFSLRQTGTPPCHYDVDLGEEITLEVVARFEAAFEPPRSNPCPVRRN